MIFTLKDLSAKTRSQIQMFTQIRPVPQFPAWENTAVQLLKKGEKLAAAILLDIATRFYGKSVTRASFERILGIPVKKLGRGITECCGFAYHPGIYTLRDFVKPQKLGNYVAVRAGSNLVLATDWPQSYILVHPFSDAPQSAPQYPSKYDSAPIQFIGIDSWLIYTRGTHTVTCVDLSIPKLQDNTPLQYRTATLEFDSPVKNICGPLSDGTFFVTTESDIPVFSDVCHLCRIDFNKVQMFTMMSPNLLCDIRKIDALDKDIILPNIEQTLRGDCVAADQAFVTCGGGMQNHEVRFINADGSWTTRFVHENPVIRMIQSECGPVSLDNTGRAFLWNEMKPVDDFQFCFEKMPQIFKDNLEDTDFTIDWTHKRLYLTLTQPPQSTLKAALLASHSCRIDADSADSNDFVKKMFHVGDKTIAMLGDASYHFWDNTLDCVDPGWQLPDSCADNLDWQQMLNDNTPSVDKDPRIRILHVV